MLEEGLWHPVAAAATLGNQPLAVTVLGHNLVLWRGEAGQPQAWADRCPHRGARLSLGQVIALHTGQPALACPYHGWAFSSGGRCVQVPARPDWVPPAGHAVRTHEAAEHLGLVWVRLQKPSPELPTGLQDLPKWLPGQAEGWRQLLCGPYAVATSAARLVENFLDMSHFGFVHRGWLGDAEHAQVDVGHVQETPCGVLAERAQAWQPRGYASATSGQMVSYRYEVLAPWAATLEKVADPSDSSAAQAGPCNAIALFVNPQGPEECVAWFAMATLNDPTSDDELRRFQDAVFAQDKPIVESQVPRRLPLATPLRLAAASDSAAWPPEVHGPADRLSAAYRRYLLRLGVGHGVC